MGDKLAQFEREAREKAQASGRYKERRARRPQWEPIAAPEAALQCVVWATSDVNLVAFLVSRGAKPGIAANLQSDEVIYGFSEIPEKDVAIWESGPKDYIDRDRYDLARETLLKRTRKATRAYLETVLLGL